jgi:hypothetical protein
MVLPIPGKVEMGRKWTKMVEEVVAKVEASSRAS